MSDLESWNGDRIDFDIAMETLLGAAGGKVTRWVWTAVTLRRPRAFTRSPLVAVGRTAKVFRPPPA